MQYKDPSKEAQKETILFLKKALKPENEESESL